MTEKKKATKQKPFLKKVVDSIKKKTLSYKKHVAKHKKIFLRTSILIGILLVAIILFYMASIQVKLLFDTETYIELSPSIRSITLEEKQTTNISFTTKVESLRICDVYCTYTLLQGNNQEKLRSETLLAPKEKVSTFSLTMPEIGSGQLIYNYKVNCTTTQKTLCPSKGKTYEKTAFLTINYPLSKKEQEIQEETRPLLEENTLLFSELKTKNIRTQKQIELVQRYAQTNITTNELLESVLDYLQVDEENILTLWRTQAFQESKEELNTFKKSLKLFEERLDTASKTAKKELEELESSQNILLDIANNKEIVMKQAPLIRENNNSMYQELLEANTTFNHLINEQKNYSSTEQEQKAQEIQTIIENINTTYTQLREEQKQKEHNISTQYASILNNLSQNIEINCTNIPKLETSITNYDLSTNVTTNTSSITYYATHFCTQKNISLFTKNISLNNFTIIIENETQTKIPTPEAQCTYNEETKTCGKEKNIPIVLVHGHSFSKSTSAELAFTRLLFLQESLAQDGYINAGTLGAEANINAIPKGDWSQNPAPIVIGVTYYYLQHYELGTLSFTTRKTDRIENYAIRLKESIEDVKEKTDSEQVIIIAHSMGGLVARSYLHLFGEESVDTLIILGTPNHGVEADIKKYCTLTGAKNECEDMAVNSPFLQNLNKENNIPHTTKIYTIAAEGCPTKNDAGGTEEGDGVVLKRSVALDYAEANYVVQGTCTDTLQKELHMNFVNTKMYPETYEIIKEILEE